MDHDRLYKELLTNFFPEFLDLFLPRLAESLESAAIEFLDKEVFADLATGAKHEADLVAKARLRGRESFFLIHLEHQAQPQPEFAQRMFDYFAALRRRYHLPVYPIALFSHSSMQPEPDEYREGFPDLEVLRFHFRVIQLSRLSWRDFLQRANPVASALMTRMGVAAEDRPRVKLECLRLLVGLRLDPARMRLVSGFVDSYLRLDAQEKLIFEQEASKMLNRTEQTKVMELTTSWKEEGLQEGLQEGERRLVLRLLRRRFGAIPQDLEPRLAQLPVDQLEALGEALLDFTSQADLRRWLSSLPGSGASPK